ncbi:MAG: hypothetical protein D3926_23440 [Desulfobacteraceae bacterium]|nr:MAG: hypothetical protein D3926_23440 [Desulfobacteraceae bacterium]
MGLIKKYIWGFVFLLMGIVFFFSGDVSFKLVPMKGQFIGSVCIIGGILTIIQKYFYTKKHGNMYVICDTCSKKFKLEHVEIPKCPICNGKLVLFKDENSQNC